MPVKKQEVIEIKPVSMDIAPLTIIGETPLVVHKWSFKAMMEMLGDKKLKKKIPRNPAAEVAASLYWMDEERDPFPALPYTMIENGMGMYEALLEKYEAYTEEDFIRDAQGARFGFPVTAIKKAAIATVFRNGMSKDKVSLQGTFFLSGEGENQLVEIKSPTLPIVRQDYVRVGMGSADIRYRPQFDKWSMDISVKYNSNSTLALKDVFNMIHMGGQLNGIGEWRIEKGGIFGSFRVGTE